MSYYPELGLLIADTCLLAFYLLILGYEIFVIVHYYVPLGIKSPYTIAFYVLLTILLLSCIVELFFRLTLAQMGYQPHESHRITVSEVCQNVTALSYLLLGFVISATMFQLSCSLALMLNIIDINEADARKISFNICLSVIGVVCTVGAVYELMFNRFAQKEHLIFETMGLLVLCVIYFSTSIELYRKLRIFVLEETRKESRLVQL